MSINPAIRYLNQSTNSLVREQLLNYKLFYDLQLAAAYDQEALKIYQPAVDNQGCDIVIEDNLDFSRKIQLKSKVESKTKEWKIHRSILLPGMLQADDFGFDATICPTNPGAFIIIDVSRPKKENSDELSISYWYTDFNIISLIADGIFKSKESTKKEAIKTINLLMTTKNKQIVIKKSLMVKVQKPSSLLDLCGFLNRYGFYFNVWKLNQVKNKPSKYFTWYEPYNVGAAYLKKLKTQTEEAKKSHIDFVIKLLEQVTCR